MHVIPPPMTGNYMPTGPNIEVDYSQFTYGPKQTQPSESKTSEIDTCLSDAPIIEEYESDSEDEYVSLPTKEQETPINTARALAVTKNVRVAARHSFYSKVVPTSAAMKSYSYEAYVNRLVLLGEKGKLLLSPQQVVIGDQKDTTTGKIIFTRALQNKGIVDSGCSRHMTGNKAYLAEYQDFNGGPLLLEDSKGYNKTGKGIIESVGQKGSRGNTVMPELHNKIELLKERTRPLLRLLGLC
ncbi:hypothetical protein Tco_1555090 [Tanacetum coccineum]